jgi:CRP-like cAMP-binding protein
MFRQLSDSELDFVSGLKRGQLEFGPREHILEAGGNGGLLYTLFSGWAFRYITVEKAGRQILNFLLPGDLIGLQSPLTGRMQYSVCSITAVSVCELTANPFHTIFNGQPELGAALLQTALMDQARADRRLALLGRQRPVQRLAYLMLELRDRLCARGMGDAEHTEFPLTYDMMADAMGLSRAQLARSLAELRERMWARVRDGKLHVLEPQKMAELCGYTSAPSEPLRTLL